MNKTNAQLTRHSFLVKGDIDEMWSTFQGHETYIQFARVQGVHFIHNGFATR